MGRSRKRIKRQNDGEQALGVKMAEQPKAEEELQLESLLFGAKKPLPSQNKGKQRVEQGEHDSDQEEPSVNITDDQLFFVDAPAAQPSQALQIPLEAVSDDEEGKEPEASTSAGPLARRSKASVWHDPADETATVSLAHTNRLRKLRSNAKEDLIQGDAYANKLRQQFEKVNPAPQWAAAARLKNKRKAKGLSLGEGSDSDLDEQEQAQGLAASNAAHRLLRKASHQTQVPTRLQADRIAIARVEDANKAVSSKCGIRSIGFHPQAPVLFTVSSDRRLRLFRIDGKHNRLIKTLHVPELPLSAAQFHPSGNAMLLLGHAPFFLIYNLTNGNIRKCRTDIAAGQSLIYRFSPDGSILAQVKSGEVRLLDWASGAQLLLSVQQPTGEVRDLQWLDQNIFATFSSSAEVFVWNASTRECISRWRDESGFGAQAMNACPDFVAISSNTGIVNVYDCDTALAASDEVVKERKPLKTLLNLTTAADILRFNPSSQLLAMASSDKQDTLKLVHTGGMTVFPNWPTAATPLGRVTDVAFSNNSEYMAISNHKGKVLLYRIEHFAAKFKSK